MPKGGDVDESRLESSQTPNQMTNSMKNFSRLAKIHLQGAQIKHVGIPLWGTNMVAVKVSMRQKAANKINS